MWESSLDDRVVEQRVGTDEASWCARFAGNRWSLASPLNPVLCRPWWWLVSMELDPKVHAQITQLSEAGNEMLEVGNSDGALAAFERALSVVPSPLEEWEAATWLFTSIAECHFVAGNFAAARVNALKAVQCPGGLGNPFVHLRLGQAEFELGNTERAKDELARAYMGGGDEVFEGDDPKYWRFIREILRPPAREIGE